MSIYRTTSGRLALRCDVCGRTFHPRHAADAISLRRLAFRQAWRVRPPRDLCSADCLEAPEPTPTEEP